MEQFEPSSEEDRERLTIMKISLLKQFQELKGIRDQVLFYITSIETGEVGNIDDQVKSDPAIVATDDVKNVKNEESVIVIENSQAWVEDANVEELEQDEDVEQTGQVEESYEEEDSGAKQYFQINLGYLWRTVDKSILLLRI